MVYDPCKSEFEKMTAVVKKLQKDLILYWILLHCGVSCLCGDIETPARISPDILSCYKEKRQILWSFA